MSHKETKRIATFLEPGTFVGNSSQRYVESLDPYAIVWPENAYAVVLSEREDIVDGKTTYTGPVKGGAITYYHPDSRRLDANGNCSRKRLHPGSANSRLSLACLQTTEPRTQKWV